MKRFLGRSYTVVMFVILQTVLYGTFLTLDLTGTYLSLSSKIKFSIILLCFCYALLSGKGVGKGIIFSADRNQLGHISISKSTLHLMKAAILFTVISDLFLLILDYYYYGVLTFIVVQQLYALRLQLSGNGEEKEKKHLNQLRRWMIRLTLQVMAAVIVCLILTWLGVSLEALLVTSVFYFICILTNTLMALKAAFQHQRDRGLVLFAIGMVLFLLCDINVGLFNLSGFISLPADIGQAVYSVSSILMWTFYAPSQVLIALSCRHIPDFRE